MKKYIWLLALEVLLLNQSLYAWHRLGNGTTPVTQNTGDKATALSVTVSSTAASLVVAANDINREVLLENTDPTFSVDCGTFSAITSASGVKRWRVPPLPSCFYTNFTGNIYCIGAPGSSSIEVVGSAEYDSGDKTQ